MGKFDINSDSSDPFAIQLNQFSNLLSTTSAKQISSHIVSNGIICTRDVKGAALHVSHRMTSTSSCLVTSNHRDSTTQLVSHNTESNFESELKSYLTTPLGKGGYFDKNDKKLKMIDKGTNPKTLKEAVEED